MCHGFAEGATRKKKERWKNSTGRGWQSFKKKWVKEDDVEDEEEVNDEESCSLKGGQQTSSGRWWRHVENDVLERQRQRFTEKVF